ncbi:MAG: alpha-ketoglutarate-dependent dioxygenase AlkB [Myxococcales bacterium]
MNRRPGPYRPARRWESGGRSEYGLYYQQRFVTPADRDEILAWLAQLHPIWEQRYSTRRPPPEGQTQRMLLRPVYWLGNWQFACLDYYRPPHGVLDRCVTAEPFPPVLARLVRKIEGISKRIFHPEDLPEGWHLNTCLVNLYGSRLEDGREVDTARVGEHRDFEPGPVASVSLGERALFQFVSSKRPGEREGVVSQQWLDDGSLQIFGGDKWKKHTFHRVQRVDHRANLSLPPLRDDFVTRRVNFTFRYVPDEHVIPFARLSPEAREDVRAYVEELARHSRFFAAELAKSPR